MYVSDFLTAAAIAHRDELIRSASERRRGALPRTAKRRLFAGRRSVAAEAARAVADERVPLADRRTPVTAELTVICGR
jgi:hypothetical protein